MKILTKKIIATSQSDKILFLPRFGLIIAITFLILFAYFDIFFYNNTDTWLYVAMIITAIISTMLLVALKKIIKSRSQNGNVEILIDTVIDKKMQLSFSKYSSHKYFLYLEKTGIISIEDIIKYSKYKIGDKCFLARFDNLGSWSVYNCNKYELADELKPFVIPSEN